jgi:NADH-quinone oxidoreductase subunit M
VCALLILLVPKANTELPRRLAVLGTGLSFLLSLVPLFGLKHNADFQFTEHKLWLKDLGISYFLGVDGISVLLVAITSLLGLLAVIWSWSAVDHRPREYYLGLLLVVTGMLGIFMALDLFIFYIFWEVMLIPLALMIGVWGGPNRVYAAVKFFLYTFFGSLLMLVGIVATYQAYFNQTNVRTLNVLELQRGNYSHDFQFWVFAAFFIAFAIKVPIFPFHTWLPDVQMQAPTVASVMLTSEIGAYGIIRFCLPLFPQGLKDWTPVIITLSLIAVIYAALIAFVQPDVKRLVAYASISHLGLLTVGLFVGNIQGMDGAIMLMMAHGFNTGAMFLLAGMLYQRAKNLEIDSFGGLATRMPIWTSFLGIFVLASIGLPGLSSFVGEFLVSLGTWHYNRWLTIVTLGVIILSAWYLLTFFQRMAFGRASRELPDPGDGELTDGERRELAASAAGGNHGHGHGHLAPVSGGAHEVDDADVLIATHDGQLDSVNWTDLTPREILTLLPLAALTIFFGVYPKPILNIAEPSFQAILSGATRVIGN